MKFVVHSFRNGEIIFENDDKFAEDWKELIGTLSDIKEKEIIEYFQNSGRKSQKSISEAINKLIDKRLVKLEWNRQSPIFNESEYRPHSKGYCWTLDFTKNNFAVEVAFNHGEAVAWNLIKPVLSSELNHVEKVIQTYGGILIVATDEMKKAGNFDGACGTYEKYLQYLKPLQNILTVPMVIIGLKAPKTFKINKDTKKVEYISNIDCKEIEEDFIINNN